MAKRINKKQSKSRLLKVEALEQRQLLASGFTAAQGQEFSDITHPNGNVYDQVLLKTSAITVANDPGQITRVSFLDLQGDIVQAEFGGSGTLSISMDAATFATGQAPTGYNQAGISYVKGLATFTIQGADASTNLTLFSVGSGVQFVNPGLFDSTHTGGDHTADVQRVTIVANPTNPNGSVFGSINAGNAIFGGDSGVVGITAANVQVQNRVVVGDIVAKGTATPTLTFGTSSQFGDVIVAGGGLISPNGKAINNTGSYAYGVSLVAGTKSDGSPDAAENTYSQMTFTGVSPVGGQVAKTITLTSLSDTGTAFTGTASDDTFVAVVGSNGLSANGTTLNAGDAINGGAGIDTLNLSVSGTNTADQTTASFTLTNVEKIDIANFESSAFATNLDLATSPGLTNISVVASSATGDTTVNNVQGLVAASMANGTGDLTLNYIASAVVGTADAQALTLSGQSGGTFMADGIETINVASNGSANTTTLAGSALATVNVTGAQNLTLGTLAATVTKLDASAATGKISASGSTAVDYNITGGSANDTITLDGGFFTAADSVNGGGGTDTLVVDVVVTAATLAKVSNVETLKVTGSNALTFAENVSPTSFDLSDSGDQFLTLTTSLTTAYSNATTVTLTGDNAANADKILNSANVALTVNANTDDIDGTTTITGGTGTDTINLVAKTAAGAATLTAVTNVEQINITGSETATVTLADGNTASGKQLTIDASAATGNLTIAGGADTNGLQKIITGSGKDTITAGGGGKDTVSSGGGDDSISIAALTATVVIDSGAGSDSLTVSGTDIASTAVLVGVTNTEKLVLGGSVDLTLAAPITATTGITTVDISDASDNIVTLNTGFTDALSVVITGDTASADKIVNAANVNLTVTGNVADIAAATTITGGTGTDILNLKADTGTAVTTNLSGIESIIIGINSVTPTNGATVTMGSNNTQVAAGKTLVVDASALTDSGAVFTFNGDTAETDGFLSVTGGAGADVLKGGGSGFDTLIGGAGNDSFTLATLQATNIVSGGAGSADKLTVTTDIPTSSSFLGVTGVETLKLGASTDVTITSNIRTATGIATIDASDASDNIITIAGGVSDAFTVVLTGDNANADKIVNSANTSLTVTAGVADIDNTTTITGGTGTDVVNLKAVAGADAADFSATTGIETITIAKSGFTSTITVGADTVVAAGKTLTINGSAADAALTIVGTAETDGSLVITGGTAADTISGGGAADTFTGGSGADTFNMVPHTNKLTFDRITDAATNDVINTADKGTETFNSAKLNLGSLATFTDYLDAAAAGDGHTNGIYRWFQFNGNTYVVFDVSAATDFQSNADSVIEIAGLVDLSTAVLGDHTITIA